MIRSHKHQRSPSAVTYMNKKGIHQLFEAMMTALMVHKPKDHITFMRECLDKVENNPPQLNWDFFVSYEQRFLPSIHRHSFKPIVFILSSSGSLQLSSRLLKRYQNMEFLFINDIADIDDDDPIDLREHEYRYECIEHELEQRRSDVSGFLISGELTEQDFLDQWKEKLGRLDLILIFSSNPPQQKLNENFHLIQIDSNTDIDAILTHVSDSFDQLFPQDAFLRHRSQTIFLETRKSHPSPLPILFCVADESITTNENEDLQTKNSFVSILCQRLAKDLHFKHIYYVNDLFEQLKEQIDNTQSGCIIEHFPTSSNVLQRFQSEIGVCSALIYISDYRLQAKHDQFNSILRHIKGNRRILHVDCRLEVDEIYDDLKSELLEYI